MESTSTGAQLFETAAQEREAVEHRRSISPEEFDVQQYLQGMDYPAPRNKLIATVLGNGAPDTVVERLRRLPETADFRTQEDLERALTGGDTGQ